MKNWSSILERAIEDVNQAFGVNVTEYGRYLIKRGGRERRVADCHLDVEYERTDQALKAAWQRIADLPTQIADDVHVSTRVEAFVGYVLVPLVLPSTRRSGERKPIEIAGSKFQMQTVRFSPDSRFIARDQ